MVAKNYSWPRRIIIGLEELLLAAKNCSWPQHELFFAAKSNSLQPRVIRAKSNWLRSRVIRCGQELEIEEVDKAISCLVMLEKQASQATQRPRMLSLVGLSKLLKSSSRPKWPPSFSIKQDLGQMAVMLGDSPSSSQAAPACTRSSEALKTPSLEFETLVKYLEQVPNQLGQFASSKIPLSRT
ncbi:hypothetical protein RHMOL_Rhmol12G0172400 [Rhododendron molle]|uniref:Uncharacterized protein n=1 Tax=Rhododendron molle TaxID=49168 RepID=A0ACC0LJ74_RHOML|nr:hypothetical protein RHMOL_Rhmol12G0172400 [Rhododendron molle]